MPRAHFLRTLKNRAREELKIARALARLEPSLLKKPNVVGHGVGYKKKGGRTLKRLAAVFFVKKKVPLSKLAPSERLPRFIKVGTRRVPTDVRHFPPFRPFQAPNRARTRPVLMGSSISACPPNQDTTPFGTGTAGAVVHDANDSAAH